LLRLIVGGRAAGRSRAGRLAARKNTASGLDGSSGFFAAGR
jgi:hypothetical protein